MRNKLENPLIEILHTRTYISRETKLFTLEKLVTNWAFSIPTLYRYDSLKHRLKSRAVAKKAYKLLVRDVTKCQLCGSELKKHLRCPDCTMLLHGAPECSCALIKSFLEENDRLLH